MHSKSSTNATARRSGSVFSGCAASFRLFPVAGTLLGHAHRRGDRLRGEEPLVDHLAEAVYHARPIEVDARRALVLP